MKISPTRPAAINAEQPKPVAVTQTAAPIGTAKWAPATGTSPVRDRSAAPAAPGDVVRRFYDAFEAHDSAAMANLYAGDVKFKDAIFSFTDKPGVVGMWQKIFKADPNAKLKFTVDKVDGDVVIGKWIADYHLGKRPVHNEVSTTMRVKDGKIVEHTDDFSWKKWAPQALPAGKVFTLPGFEQLAKGLMRSLLG